MSKPAKSVVRASFWPLIVKVLGAVAAFGLSVFLARTLGVAEFGAYALVVSAIMMLAIPVQAGLPILATREVSRAAVQGRNAAIYAYLSWSNRIMLAYSALVVVVVALLWLLFPGPGFLRNLLVAVLSVLTIALTLRNSAVLRGLGHFTKGTLPDVLLRPAVQLAGFFVLFSVSTDLAGQASWALAIFFGSSACAYAISAVWQRGVLPENDSPAGSNDHMPAAEWRKAALLLTIVGGGQIFFGHIDTLILGLFGNDAEVGAYRVAVQLSMLMIFALTVVNQVLQPRLSQLYTQNDMAAFQKLVADTSLVMFLATAILAILLLSVAAPLLGFVFGDEFRIAAPALQILILGQTINVFFGSVGTILNMTGLEKEATRGMLIAIVVNVALDFLLIPIYGLLGAALASALSIAIWNAILRHYVKTRLDVESSGAIVYACRVFNRKRATITRDPE